jgi:hypothetical protein
MPILVGQIPIYRWCVFKIEHVCTDVSLRPAGRHQHFGRRGRFHPGFLINSSTGKLQHTSTMAMRTWEQDLSDGEWFLANVSNILCLVNWSVELWLYIYIIYTNHIIANLPMFLVHMPCELMFFKQSFITWSRVDPISTRKRMWESWSRHVRVSPMVLPFLVHLTCCWCSVGWCVTYSIMFSQSNTVADLINIDIHNVCVQYIIYPICLHV